MNDLQTINVLKGLIIDGVNKAKAGHPGGAMSSIDFAYILFTEFLRFDPADPKWPGRDRFILSAGHESMLLYAMLNFIGWLDTDELKRFRQLHSKTPGHPENFITPGVECTTGPLGQGAAMSVGFAIAAKHLAAKLDKDLFAQRAFAILGDGCMQEDITLGAASYAGHLKLANLVWYYDRNRVQISGTTDRSTSDDEMTIFRGFGWDVTEVDGHNHDAIRAALQKALEPKREKPCLIIGNTIMAHGTATMEGSHEAHGAPLPAQERLDTKKKLGLPLDHDFYRPEEAIKQFQKNFAVNSRMARSWHERLNKLIESKPDFKRSYDAYFGKEDFSTLPAMTWPKDKAVATRNAFGDIIERWADTLPKLIGGSADLEPSNMTGAFAKKVGDFQAYSPEGRNFAFGVREFPMSAVCNGIALYGGLIPFDATFLTFSDYSRAALRLGAIQRARVIHEFTHDSFHLGEDGPTHQAVEHVMSLRLIPNFYVMRPADAYETEVMMRVALGLRESQSAICLSRQKLPILQISKDAMAEAVRGAYVVHDVPEPEYIIFATGSEVALALETLPKLGTTKVRIVSVPCWELFDEQEPAYRDKILAWDVDKRVSIEAGVTLGWQRFTGAKGLNIGVDHFGDSAPAEALAVEYGFTADSIAAKILNHKF